MNILKNAFHATLLLSLIATSAFAGTGSWKSKTTGANINYTTTEPSKPAKDESGKQMTIVYLENLAVENISTISNKDNVKWLLDEGYRVIELDYNKSKLAVSPNINLDIIAINDELNKGAFCGTSNISTTRAYILMEGYRLQRNVSYCLDDPTVYNWPGNTTKADSLYMDVCYPAEPKAPVPVILSPAYSNSYYGKPNQRMFLGYTLSMFDDSILEGAPAVGMAWAIADHPKYCDWGQGKPVGGANKDLGAIELNPDAACKMRSAVRTLRGLRNDMGLSGSVAVFGFSRGSTASSLLIGDNPFPAWLDTTKGRFPDEKADIQAAILGPGVFDYSKMPAGSNEYKRMAKYCGEYSASNEKWAQQGGALAIKESAAPCFLFYNKDDAPEYATQMDNLMSILTATGTTFETLFNYGTGHSVPTKPEDIQRIYDFLNKHVATAPSGIKPAIATTPRSAKHHTYDLNGRKTSSTQAKHGIYIRQGKKIVK